MNRQGSAIIPVLVVLAIISYLAVRAMEIVGPLQAMRQQEMARAARDSLSTSLKMMYRTRGVCMNNLMKDSALGSTLTELNTKSVANTAAIPFASVDGSSSSQTLNVGGETDGLKVNNIRWGPTRLITTKFDAITKEANNSYLLDLIVGLEPLGKGMKMTISIPFYIFADGAGRITDCYASSYTKSSVTSEDQLCLLGYGLNFIYSPLDHTCIRKRVGNS